MVFQVALKLRENDDEAEHLCEILAAVSRSRSGVRLCGGGGYFKHSKDVAVLFFQTNDHETGDLRDCDESDREHARAVLAQHPNVISFALGPLESDVETSNAEADAAEKSLVESLESRASATV